MKRPFLSVVIPTFNRKDSLLRTFNGLASQTYPRDRFEAVVVSDGSTDGTDDMAAEYARTARYNLRLITQPNAGPSRARNRGVQEAQGEVIVFLDDDVEPLAQTLAVHAAHHERDDKVAVIGPMAPDPLRRKTEPAWIAWEHAMLEKQYTNWRTGVWPGAGPCHFYSGNASVRRAHILASGGFNETFKRQEDVELAYRMYRKSGVHYVFDPQAAGTHRPTRSFSSWLAVPYAYGQLDVVRARCGEASWQVVQNGYHNRSMPTRLLASLTLTCPALSRPLRSVLLSSATLCFRVGLSDLSMDALSVICNLRYLEGVLAEIGTRHDTLRLLHQKTVTAT